MFYKLPSLQQFVLTMEVGFGYSPELLWVVVVVVVIPSGTADLLSMLSLEGH